MEFRNKTIGLSTPSVFNKFLLVKMVLSLVLGPHVEHAFLPPILRCSREWATSLVSWQPGLPFLPSPSLMLTLQGLCPEGSAVYVDSFSQSAREPAMVIRPLWVLHQHRIILWESEPFAVCFKPFKSTTRSTLPITPTDLPVKPRTDPGLGAFRRPEHLARI